MTDDITQLITDDNERLSALLESIQQDDSRVNQLLAELHSDERLQALLADIAKWDRCYTLAK